MQDTVAAGAESACAHVACAGNDDSSELQSGPEGRGNSLRDWLWNLMQDPPQTSEDEDVRSVQQDPLAPYADSGE